MLFNTSWREIKTASPVAELSEQIVALKMPESILCLLSALRFHNFTTQLPHEVWIAVQPGSWIPQSNIPAIRIVTLSKVSYNYDIEKHVIGGMTLKVYSAAKTVTDCFKFRNKIGLDVALEALLEGHKLKLFTATEIYQAAKACRDQGFSCGKRNPTRLLPYSLTYYHKTSGETYQFEKSAIFLPNNLTFI